MSSALPLQWAPGAPAIPSGRPLELEPRLRLDIGGVVVGPFEEPMEEIRFAPGTGELAALFLRIPEEKLVQWDWLEPWRNAPAVETGLRSPGGVSVPRATQFLMDADEGSLACVRFEAEGVPGAAFRARVAPDLDLLFGDAVYRGWMLHRAAHHLARGWEPPAAAVEPEADLPELLAEYLRLTDIHHHRLLHEAEPAQRDRLETLRRRLGYAGPASPQRDALRAQVSDVLARYFG